MSQIGDLLSLGLERLETQLSDDNFDPPHFTWNGRSYPCVPNSLGLSHTPQEGGYDEDVDLVLIVRKNAKIEPVTADSDQITVDDDSIIVDSDSKGHEFDDTLTVDSALVTVDSDLITADNESELPESGDVITFRNVDYEVISRQEREGHYRFALNSNSE